MTIQKTDISFKICATLSKKITSKKLRIERERYRIRPRRSPRGHKATRHHDVNRLRYWLPSRRQGVFLIHKEHRFYRVTKKGYLVQELRATYSSDE
jgi:hypothetical protein